MNTAKRHPLCWSAMFLLALLLPVLAAPEAARAFEAADNDAFYLGFGSSNIEVANSDDLLSGSNLLGGIRIGLFWTLFVELGYGTIGYFDTADVGGTIEDIDFRTTGAHFGGGFLIPIRALQLGAKYHRSLNNRWSEERTDQATGALINRQSGGIDFDSYFIFARFMEKGQLEIGVRRDLIRDTNSILSNSFGPYLMWNFVLN